MLRFSLGKNCCKLWNLEVRKVHRKKSPETETENRRISGKIYLEIFRKIIFSQYRTNYRNSRKAPYINEPKKTSVPWKSTWTFWKISWKITWNHPKPCFSAVLPKQTNINILYYTIWTHASFIFRIIFAPICLGLKTFIVHRFLGSKGTVFIWATFKKPSYFPLNPGCLIGILIMVK